MEIIIAAVIISLWLAVGLLPTIVAMHRKHENTLAIFIVNFFLGWTGIGWVAALVWAVKK